MWSKPHLGRWSELDEGHNEICDKSFGASGTDSVSCPLTVSAVLCLFNSDTDSRRCFSFHLRKVLSISQVDPPGVFPCAACLHIGRLRPCGHHED